MFSLSLLFLNTAYVNRKCLLRLQRQEFKVVRIWVEGSPDVEDRPVAFLLCRQSFAI